MLLHQRVFLISWAAFRGTDLKADHIDFGMFLERCTHMMGVSRMQADVIVCNHQNVCGGVSEGIVAVFGEAFVLEADHLDIFPLKVYRQFRAFIVRILV